MLLNKHHAKIVYRNFNGRYGDPKVLDYFYKKTTDQWYGDQPSYSYWWVALLAFGLSAGSSLRHFLYNPDVAVRRGDAKRNVVDRWRLHMYSLPFFNHSLRAFSQQFTSSLVDNEPDYGAHHEWKYRPDRHLHYGRYPLILSAPKYNIDDPHYEHCTHEAMEKYYESIGYYPNRKETEEEDD